MSLSVSERITLIKEIAKRLSGEEWPLIDLTLKQYSLPWSINWSGSKESYILKMISDAPNQTLIEVAEHVGFRLGATTPHVDPPFWRKGMLRLFLTHLSAHRQYAGELQQALAEFGISCFVAHSDIEPTLEWQVEIETALATCDALVALLHPNFHKSNWTDQEIGFAMGRGVPVFSVRFGEDPYGFIGRFQAFNGTDKKVDALAKELFDAYRKNKQTQRRMADVVIAMFADSGSYAQAKSFMAYLEELEVWDPSYSARLHSAVKHNSQVADAFGVAARVEKLIAKRSEQGG